MSLTTQPPFHKTTVCFSVLQLLDHMKVCLVKQILFTTAEWVWNTERSLDFYFLNLLASLWSVPFPWQWLYIKMNFWFCYLLVELIKVFPTYDPETQNNKKKNLLNLLKHSLCLMVTCLMVRAATHPHSYYVHTFTILKINCHRELGSCKFWWVFKYLAGDNFLLN